MLSAVAIALVLIGGVFAAGTMDQSDQMQAGSDHAAVVQVQKRPTTGPLTE